jgi:hypothetical protein
MDFVKHWWSIFCWAHVCIWEELTGEEVSCPDCWKCRWMRRAVMVLYAFAACVLGSWAIRSWM